MLMPGLIPLDEAENSQMQQRIIDQVCYHFKVPIPIMLSPCRKRKICYPRQLIMYLMHMKTSLTLNEIAKQVGRHDHATTIHSINTIKDLKFSDPKVNDDIQHFMTSI